MPDLFMDVDTALSEVPVNIAPLIDDTDFKTIEGAVAYNAAGMTLFWHFVTTGGAYTLTAVTPTTAGDYDWTDQGAAGIYTIEIPASGGASINNDTEGFGWFSGVATGVLPWRGPTIGFRAAALNNSMIDGTTIDVNVTAMAASVLTATAIASDAITAAKIAADAITAAKIATGAIDADALATDAVAEIVAAIVADKSSGIASYGVLDAGAASGGTFPAGQRANVAAGDAVWIPGKGGPRIIASGYNSTTGVFTTVSAFGSAAAASDSYVVFAVPKAEELQAADFADGFLTAAKLAADCITDAKVASDVTIASVTGAVGSVTGAVGSVTGAVGTVTGNVGGSVAGSVGSVTATVSADVTQISGDSTAADNAELFFDGTGYAGTGNVIPTVTTLTNKTGFSLADAPGIKINTAFTNFEFQMVSSTDHVTPGTGLTVTSTRSIDGGAYAACANSAAEVGSGTYKIDLAAADLSGTCITFKFTASTADATYVTIVTET